MKMSLILCFSKVDATVCPNLSVQINTILLQHLIPTFLLLQDSDESSTYLFDATLP
ncbi:unnamed protein product [Sphagnum jensenii]|uniref:Uncharacterized protein n=2 Tax=Sphagnum jensenii TaxID=128206 RepID=A0ABP0V830_9BRYO